MNDGYEIPKKTQSGYTKTRTVIIIFVITVVLSLGICIAIYFVSSKNCSCKYNDQISVTNNSSVGNITTDVSDDHVTSDATTGVPVTCTPQTDNAHVCPNNWIRYNESCYLFNHADVTFNDAKTFCEQFDADVVQLDSPDENVFVKDHLKLLKVSEYWLGLTSTAEENVWTWYETDTQATFFDWGDSEPNLNDNVYCVAFHHVRNYQWADVGCQSENKAICKLHLSG